MRQFCQRLTASTHKKTLERRQLPKLGRHRRQRVVGQLRHAVRRQAIDTTTTAHPQGFEGCELPNLTRQVGELVVVELAKKSVLTRRGETVAHAKVIERSEAADLTRNRGQAVVAQLHSNASATSESAPATYVQPRQLRHDQHARGDLGEGVAVELLETASKQRHENNEEAHIELGHARQLRDVVGHGDELKAAQLRRTSGA